jgi:hypothetical protein
MASNIRFRERAYPVIDRNEDVRESPQRYHCLVGKRFGVKCLKEKVSALLSLSFRPTMRRAKYAEGPKLHDTGGRGVER